MTVCFWRLDFVFSDFLMSDGLASHCRMMSESPWQFNIFALLIAGNMSFAPFVSTNVDTPYPKYYTFMLNSNSFQHKVVTLNNWQPADLGGAIDSFAWFRLCLTFGARSAL